MASKCKCGNTDNYNFALNIGLCDICIGEKLERQDELIKVFKTRIDQLEYQEICEDCSAKTELPQSEIGCKAKEQIKKLEAENDKYKDALVRIDTWAKAYPRDIFPKPDLKQAAKILKAADMTLDAISADTMRHVLDGVKDITEQALKG